MSLSDDKNDHDRLVRIETLVEGLGKIVAEHTDALRQHIEDESVELREIREKVGMVSGLKEDVQTLKTEVKDLQTLKNKALGWVAALILAGGIIWELIIKSVTATKGGG